MSLLPPVVILFLLFRGDYILANTCGAFYGGGGRGAAKKIKKFCICQKICVPLHPIWVHQTNRSQFATIKTEGEVLSSQNASIDMRGRHVKYMPYAFTESGIAMLSGVLRSQSIQTYSVANQLLSEKVKKIFK